VKRVARASPDPRNILSIAVDDVDSPAGGCTTHFTGLLLAELEKAGATLLDYPLLVRLNPGIPWKTRGNAATVLRITGLDLREAIDIVGWMVSEYTVDRPFEPGKGAGFVILEGYPWRPGLRWLYRKGLSSILAADQVEYVINHYGGYLSGGRGRIGAAAAIAALAPWDDYTYELVAYRRPERWGKPRCVRLREGEAWTAACAFNNYDLTTRVLVAAPHGPDPVLAGFRGDCPGPLARYANMVCEEPHFWVVYRSNQHTDAHALLGSPSGIHPYEYVHVRATIIGNPRIAPGGHTIVEALIEGRPADLAFYREAYPLNEEARLLAPGDKVELMGSVRPYGDGRPTIAVDKFRVLEATPRYRRVAPLCVRCGSRMKSAGRGGGYKCPKCGYQDPLASPSSIYEPRVAPLGWRAPRPGRLRHLTAPPWRVRNPSPPPPLRWEHVPWRSVASWSSEPPTQHPPISSGLD